jgi:hypothetical protein
VRSCNSDADRSAVRTTSFSSRYVVCLLLPWCRPAFPSRSVTDEFCRFIRRSRASDERRTLAIRRKGENRFRSPFGLSSTFYRIPQAYETQSISRLWVLQLVLERNLDPLPRQAQGDLRRVPIASFPRRRYRTPPQVRSGLGSERSRNRLPQGRRAAKRPSQDGVRRADFVLRLRVRYAPCL